MNLDSLVAGFGEQQVAGFILVLARISPLFVLAPLFSSSMVPARARSVVAVALAVGIAPLALAPHAHVPIDALGYSALLLKEVLVGLGFSFSLGALFAAFSAAGGFADAVVGFSFGSLLDPITGNQGGVLNQVYAMFGLLIFVAINGDGWVIEGLARSYDAIPLTASPDIRSLTHGAELAFSGIFASAVEICAPVLLAMLLTDAAFGLVSRVMPSLNVFAVGFPAKVTVGLIVLAASLPFVGGWAGDQLQGSVASALNMLQASG
jgi:flagellar biosynthetic protein FliR